MRKLFLALCLFANFSLFSNSIIISDRHDFTNADAIANFNMSGCVHIAAPFISGSSDELEWIENVENKRVLVVIHGYNNDYGEALEFFRKVEGKANHLYDTCICYLWPGGDQKRDYFDARARATGLILPERLLCLLEDISAHGKQVDVIAHSMGCRLALEALTIPSQLGINNVFLMAPAVDNEALEQGQKYGKAIDRCQNIFTFYSRNDSVVRWLYPIAEGDYSLGAHGSENPHNLSYRIHMIDSTSHVPDHGDYADSSFVFDRISSILEDQRMGL